MARDMEMGDCEDRIDKNLHIKAGRFGSGFYFFLNIFGSPAPLIRHSYFLNLELDESEQASSLDFESLATCRMRLT